MGDRRMAEIKTSEGSLYIYTHWHGSELPAIAREAVEKAKVRLGDESYWTRIVIDQIIKDGRDQSMGWGIMLKPNVEDEYNDDKPSVILDAKDGSIRILESKDED